MAENPTEPGARLPSVWLLGIVLGVLNGIVLLEFGRTGLPFLVMTLLLIAWKGPRFMALAGLLTGAGVLWTVLFGRVVLSCVFASPLPGEDCNASGIGPWVILAAVTFVAGHTASAFALRRARRRC